MSFGQAITSAFRQYAGFHGRSRRSEYWWFLLFTFLVSSGAAFVDGVLGLADDAGNGPIGVVLGLALLLPGLAVGVRRLHDTGRSGWWLLIGLVPIAGAIVLIVFFVGDSVAGPNEHGPNPKEPFVGYGQVGDGSGYGPAAPPPAYGSTPNPGTDPR